MTKLLYTNAEDMKLALMMQYRFGRGAKMVSTECGRYSSDVLIVEKDMITEIEVKISLTDFKADFRKDKHAIYEECGRKEVWTKGMKFFPHYFYFAIPESLVSKALPLLIGKPYGVVVVPDIEFKPNLRWIQASKYLRVVKRAQQMRRHPITREEELEIMSRMTSELINAKIDKPRKERKHETENDQTES